MGEASEPQPYYRPTPDRMGSIEAKFAAQMTIKDLYRFCTYPGFSEEQVSTLGAAIEVLGTVAITQAEIDEVHARATRGRR